MTHPLYRTAAWKAARKRVLERDQYLCQIRGDKCLVVATEADHIIPWRQGGAPYDDLNLRAACKPCNTSRRSNPTLLYRASPVELVKRLRALGMHDQADALEAKRRPRGSNW